MKTLVRIGAFLAMAGLAAAEVTRVDIARRAEIGASGYEKIVGTIHFAVDPQLAGNRVIADMDRAPRNAAGRVEFSADLVIIRPTNPKAGNGAALLEISNRGRRSMITNFNRGAVGDPMTELELGDKFLMREGYTLVWVGWEFDVPRGSADGIARFYREVLGARAALEQHSTAAVASVSAGPEQKLLFRETDAALPDYDNHHIQIYIADFSGPHAALLQRGLITEESNAHQYRFRDIVDPASGKWLYTVEHEVRSLLNPLYARPLINRNPDQSNNAFIRGHDAFRGTC